MIQQCTDQPLSRVVAPSAREIPAQTRTVDQWSLLESWSNVLVFESTACISVPDYLLIQLRILMKRGKNNENIIWMNENRNWMKMKWNKIEKIIKVVDWTEGRMRTKILDPYLWLDVTSCWENCGAVGRYGAGEWEPRSGSLPVTGRRLSPWNDEKVFIKCLA